MYREMIFVASCEFAISNLSISTRERENNEFRKTFSLTL